MNHPGKIKLDSRKNCRINVQTEFSLFKQNRFSLDKKSEIKRKKLLSRRSQSGSPENRSNHQNSGSLNQKRIAERMNSF